MVAARVHAREQSIKARVKADLNVEEGVLEDAKATVLSIREKILKCKDKLEEQNEVVTASEKRIHSLKRALTELEVGCLGAPLPSAAGD